MSSLRLIALAIAMSTHVGLAQAAPAQPDPASPTAKSVPVSYQSALKGYQPLREEEATPDTVWRAANEEVGNAGGHGAHASHMKQEEKPDAKVAPTNQSMGHKEKAK